ncbi:E3 ubiquitin-protein ligase RING2 [Rhipicephalus sanguineus]|uniref:RING-type E3 ubiquitin transferase n=1 Tax=Rhipicephalus sanguineus TaxID=34632 RepID=A0A9D4QDP2_RHISA|nr:E3 ubiquitin-protein ligase RING2 [Rhipicephalus sanguineus]KAH7976505.1 hypothetical protein HPB52_014800 [Rhipicephalus sanguineus]
MATDRLRTPTISHAVIEDDTEVPLHEDSFQRDLRCPICLDSLKNAVATTECLHRFCEECITTALRKCNRECPVCRTKVTSRRSLRRDYSLDIIVATLTSKVSEEDVWQSVHASDTVSSQPCENLKGDVHNQASEQTIVAEEAAEQNGCGEETSGEPFATVAGNDAGSTAHSMASLEDEADLLPIAPSTLAQRRSSYEHQNKRPESPVSTGDSVACEGGGILSNLRRSEMPQDANACAGPAHDEIYGVNTRALPPPTDANNGAACCGPSTDGTTRDGVDANSVGASNCGPCTTFSDALLRSYRNLASMTLKPHVSMLLEDPESPTFYLSVSGHATIQHVSAYLSKRISPYDAGRDDRRPPMYRIYAANMMGDLIPLSHMMMLEDVVRNVKRPGELLEMYYAKN